MGDHGVLKITSQVDIVPLAGEDLARAHGMDAGFGRGTTGRDVASFLVRILRTRETG